MDDEEMGRGKGGRVLTHEVESPIRGGADSGAFGTHAEGVDFNGIKPRDSLPAYAKENIIEEEKCHRAGSYLFRSGVPG